MELDRLQVQALSDRELAECLRGEIEDAGNFHLFVTEALARILIGRQWFAAVPADFVDPADSPPAAAK